MVSFDQVLDGLSRYLNKNFYANLNDWQEVLARIAVGRIIGNPEALKQSLAANGIVRTFAIMDSDGNVVDYKFDPSAARVVRDAVESLNKMQGYNEPEKSEVDAMISVAFADGGDFTG